MNARFPLGHRQGGRGHVILCEDTGGARRRLLGDLIGQGPGGLCGRGRCSGTGYSTAHASQLAQFDALRKLPASAYGSAEFSQPACHYLDNQNAAVDLVRCKMTASWCTTPALPQTPTNSGTFRPPVLPPNFPSGGGGRYCGQLNASATAGSLSRARTSVYRSIRQALRARGTAAGAPGVTVREPACLYRNERANQVTCTMTATYCR